jgi:hypothetical protein
MYMFRFNLQHFAGDEFTPDVSGATELLEDDVIDESTPQEETEESETTEEDEGQEEAGVKQEHKEPDDTTPWVKKRLQRAERTFERKFLEDANGESVGHEIPRTDLPRAVKLWNTLRVNPELSAKVNELIATEVRGGNAKTLDLVQPTGGVDVREQRLMLRESKLEFRESDPVYRKYEQDILEWAEDEGLRIRSERDLKGAIREWKGAHARTLATKAEPKATQQKRPTTTVNPTGGKQQSSNVQRPGDYRKMSTQDILKREGQSFFLPD